MELRDYQRRALEEIVEAVKTQPDVLLQAATGGGKTCVFSSLVRTFQESYRMRILILAHREQLVRQAMDKLMQWWPEGRDRVSVACSSVGKVDVSRPVIIGSPQTLAHRLEELPAIHLTIVDEAHRLPPRTDGGQYAEVIGHLREVYPAMRLVGVTATPYRLRHGYIFGSACRAPEANWFPELCWDIGIAELQRRGWLCPLDVLTAATPDLTDVKVSRTGEYDFGSLSETMERDVHLESAVKAFREYAADRRHVVIFAVTIEHAEMLAERFRAAGHAVGIVHSKLPRRERQATLEAFDRGELRFIVNVGVLTEGWDSTAIDCILLCRPTKSPALYVQMVGRGLRIHPEKRDCLLLDLSNNYAVHGPVQDPRVTWTRPHVQGECDLANPWGIPRCPKCRAEISGTDIFCPVCGHELKRLRNDCPELARPAFGGDEWPRPMAVLGEAKFTPDFWTRTGRHMFRIELVCTDDGRRTFPVSTFLDIEGQSGEWGRHKACRHWRALTSEHATVPATLAEAAERTGELRIPSAILVEKSRNGKYFNVRRWYA